jgi:Raf kinase inhibitor-like YbhB/YbcL family protein
MKITSPSFKNNGPLDKRSAYNECGGHNVSPELVWSGAPEGTQSFVLICDDPDAPKPHTPWVHWIVYNIPSSTHKLAQGQSFEGFPALQGKNSWGQKQYGGPCPPKGSGTHHYHFTLYALDIPTLYVEKTPDKAVALEAMQGHILAQTEIIGLYEIE